MRRWIVDGNNVYGSRPDGWWRDRAAAAARLVEEVGRWQQQGGDDVTVVFDGGRPEALTPSDPPRVTVAFARDEGAGSADDLIVRLVGAPGGPLTVVTSDRGLVARLPLGVAVEGAGSFLRRLVDGAGPEP
ncbi:MAG: RNA-binding protein [Acidimicrobiia bacterium]|nr:RNA-binding protein [Acidimicrobiia bacterium]